MQGSPACGAEHGDVRTSFPTGSRLIPCPHFYPSSVYNFYSFLCSRSFLRVGSLQKQAREGTAGDLSQMGPGGYRESEEPLDELVSLWPGEEMGQVLLG